MWLRKNQTKSCNNQLCIPGVINVGGNVPFPYLLLPHPSPISLFSSSTLLSSPSSSPSSIPLFSIPLPSFLLSFSSSLSSVYSPVVLLFPSSHSFSLFYIAFVFSFNTPFLPLHFSFLTFPPILPSSIFRLFSSLPLHSHSVTSPMSPFIFPFILSSVLLTQS